MAESRKKQTEVEKMLKKVEEGLEDFNNVWDNVHNATHENQREKLEAELKTQIKKLQRDREQIKLWQSDKSIKDKNALTEARRRIESEMSRFKEWERDAKTKAFSKEGLSKSDKVDPHEQERMQHRQWMQEYIDKLHVRIDELDIDLMAENSKSRKKKDQDNPEPPHAKVVQDTHRLHAARLEQLLRKLDNDEVKFAELTELKDSVQYYVDEQDTTPGEFQTWADIYDEFHLASLDDYLTRDRDRAHTDQTDGDKDEEKEKTGKADKEKAGKEEEEKADATPTTSKSESKRAGGKKDAAAAAAPTTSRSNRRAKDGDSEASTPAHKPWPPMISVWQNPAPSPAAAPAPAVEKAPPAVAKPAPVTSMPVPTAPLPAQPAPARPPAQAPPNQPPPNQPPPKPAPPAPAKQPPAQAPPQPPLPAPPAVNAPCRQASNPMPPPPSMAPPQPGAAPNCPPPSAVGPTVTPAPGLTGPTEGPPSTAPPPPPPPPPLLPPPPPAQAASMGGPPSTMPSIPQSQAKKPPVEVVEREPPAQWPPPAPFAPEERVPHVHHAPKVPPPSEAPPPPTESPPAPPAGNLASPSVPIGPAVPKEPMAPAAVVAAATGPPIAAPVPAPVHRGVAPAPPGAGTQFSAAIAAAAAAAGAGGPQGHGGHGVFEGQSMSQAGNFSVAAAAALSSHAPHDAPPGLEATSALSPRHIENLERLANSHRHLPVPSDGRRNRKYVPRNPYVHMDTRGSEAYPMHPPRGYDDQHMFDKFQFDTLFFIFYYQQGSYQQHLAAKRLKNLSWRYHTKYLSWFQRYEEPHTATAEYERGSYQQFDHEGGWCTRLKTDFTFEYQFLEDDTLV